MAVSSVFPIAVGGLFWGLHPLRVESVAWIAERKDLLSGLFGLAALLAYSRHAASQKRSAYAWTLVWFACALMSKPTVVVLPLLMLVLDWWPLQRTERVRRLLLEKTPMFAMSAAVAAVTIIGQRQAGALSFHADVPLWFRLENAVVSIAIYLRKIVWPVDLACFYPYPQSLDGLRVWGSVLLVAAITGFAVWQRKRRPYLLAGWAWFLIMLLPTIGIIQAGRQAYADRFTYWPMMGLALALAAFGAEAADRWKHRRREMAAGACCVLAVLAVLSWRQTGTWKDSETLFRHAISVADSEYMRGNLATVLMQERRYAEAKPHLERAIELGPREMHHYYNLANVYLAQGRPGEAARPARESARLAPGDPNPRHLLGLVALRTGEFEQAREEIGAAVRLGFEKDKAATLLNDAGVTLARERRFAEAEPLLRNALGYAPEMLQARRNLAALLLDQARVEEAREVLSGAPPTLARHPDFVRLRAEAGMS